MHQKTIRRSPRPGGHQLLQQVRAHFIQRDGGRPLSPVGSCSVDKKRALGRFLRASRWDSSGFPPRADLFLEVRYFPPIIRSRPFSRPSCASASTFLPIGPCYQSPSRMARSEEGGCTFVSNDSFSLTNCTEQGRRRPRFRLNPLPLWLPMNAH